VPDLFAGAVAIAHAGGTTSVEQDPGGPCFASDRQVRAAACRAQIGSRGAAAPAARRGQLVVAGAFLPGAVEVVVVRHADLTGAFDEGIDQFMPPLDVRYRQRSRRTVECVGAGPVALVRLGADEVRQHVAVGPAIVAERGPVVVVLRLPADVDESVDRARAAECLAARPVDSPAVHVRVRIRVEAPVVPLVPHRLAVADRQMDPDRPIRGPRFEEQHPHRRIFRQACGEDAAGRPGADDDVVERGGTHRAGPAPLAANRSIVMACACCWLKSIG